MRLWIPILIFVALTLFLDVGAKVKQPKVDKKAQKKQKKPKHKQEVPQVVPQQPQYYPPPPVKQAEPRLVKLKEQQEEQQWAAESRPDYGRAPQGQGQGYVAPPYPQEGQRQGYPFPSPAEAAGYGAAAPSGYAGGQVGAGPDQGQQGYPQGQGYGAPPQQAPQEPVFIPDLAKLKFVKQKHHQASRPYDHTGCGCPPAERQAAPRRAQGQTGQQDPRVTEALNDPEYIYLKMVPADELPEEGTPEAECPLLVISRKEEHLYRGCLRVLRSQADEAVAQYEAEQRWREQQQQRQRGATGQAGDAQAAQGASGPSGSAGEVPPAAPAAGTGSGSLLGDVKQAVRRATDRKADAAEEQVDRTADAVKDEIDQSIDRPEGQGQGEPAAAASDLPEQKKGPTKILEANKDLENEPIGPNGYEGIGSV